MFLIQELFPSVKNFFSSLQIPEALDRAISSIKVPESTIGRCLFCFGSELLSFFIIATNFRALAKGYLVWTVATDGLIVLQNTIVSKIFIENEKTRNGISMLSFTVGGMCGSALSILLTKYIWGS